MKHRLLAWVALAAIAAWLLHPLLTPAHVEGFSASIVSLGLHIARGDIGSYDLVHATNLEFFGLSRLGTSLTVALFASLPGVGGDGAMRATMLLGLALLVGGTWILARRWTRADPLVIAAAMLLVPGLAEGAFFYNDNLLSAGLATVALAVVVSRAGLPSTAAAGLLYGFAVLARTDAVLLAPAVALAMFERDGLARRTWLRGAVFGLSAIVPYAGILAAFGATPFDVLHISSYAVTLWDHGPLPWKQRRELMVFVGIPAMVLGALGLVRLMLDRRWLRLAMLAGVPALFNVVYYGKLYQSRQALPLAAFVVVLAVIGWQWLSTLERPRHASLVARFAVAAMVAFVLAGPVSRDRMDDGPRVATGRITGTVYWRRWQGAVRRNFRDLNALADMSGTPATAAIITDSWNADRYLHLALLQQGYQVIPPTGTACARTAELFGRGDQRVLHVRVHEPMLPSDAKLRPERFDAYVAPCLAATHPARLFFLGPVPELAERFGDAMTTDWMVHEQLTFARSGYTPEVGVMIDEPALRQLRRSYDALADAGRRDQEQRGHRAVDLATADRLLAAQVRFPR